MKKKHILLSFIGIIGLLSGWFALTWKLQVTGRLCPFKGSKMAQNRFLELEQVHDRAVEALRKEFQVPDHIWNLIIEGQYKELVAEDTLRSAPRGDIFKPGEPALTRMAKKVMSDLGVNPENLTIRLVHNSGGPCRASQDINYEAGTIIHRLDLDEGFMQHHSPAMKEAFIRHEVMHLICYDPLEGNHILAVMEHMNIPRSVYTKKQSMIDYRHQREIRADILSLCDYPEGAQAAKDYFYRLMQNDPHQDEAHLWLTHPSDKKRHQEITQLITATGTTRFA